MQVGRDHSGRCRRSSTCSWLFFIVAGFAAAVACCCGWFGRCSWPAAGVLLVYRCGCLAGRLAPLLARHCGCLLTCWLAGQLTCLLTGRLTCSLARSLHGWRPRQMSPLWLPPANLHQERPQQCPHQGARHSQHTPQPAAAAMGPSNCLLRLEWPGLKAITGKNSCWVLRDGRAADGDLVRLHGQDSEHILLLPLS